jgi:exonuclease SbcC
VNMTIERMIIENFKGVKSLTIDFDEVTQIAGRNGTGKTSIPDAFSWVLFNKDAAGNGPGTDAFREKPLDGSGREVHNLDTMVELHCRLDGAPFMLKRIQRENWVKKRGNTDAVFQGNVSTYWINGVEVKLTDFKARIAAIASEEVFRLITVMGAFTSGDWKKQRQVLLSMSGIDVDSALLAREEYRSICDQIAERGVTVDELRQVIADQRKRMNQEITLLPARIDEVRRMTPTLKPNEIEDAKCVEADTQKDIAKIDEFIAELRAQSGEGNRREQLFALESELLSIKRRMNDEFFANRRCAEKARDDAGADHRRNTAAIDDVKRRCAGAEARKAQSVAQRDALREKYKKEYESKFVEPEAESKCPTCGQALPEERIKEAIERERQRFADNKRRTLQSIQQDGAKLNDEIKEFDAQVSRMQGELRELEARAEAAKKALEDAQKEIAALPVDVDYSAEPRFAQIEEQIAAIKEEVAASPDERIKGYQERRADLVEQLRRAQEIISKKATHDDCVKRIAELEGKQRDMGAKYAEIERMIMLIERFITDRCAALEESIDKKFPTVRWKLFDVQINEGVKDTCSCMIWCDGALVPYNSANTASRLNADIEIINVLSEHYDVTVPLFFDNMERVNYIGDVRGQLITLSVSRDERLHIKTGKKREAA